MTLLPNLNHEPRPFTKPAIVLYIKKHLGVGLMEANKFYQKDTATWFKRLQDAISQTTESKIREVILEYYRALDQHKHGGIAAHNALDKIQEILGMSWEQGASRDTHVHLGLCQEIQQPGSLQPCVLDPETILPKS